jgi:hypothetical protein
MELGFPLGIRLTHAFNIVFLTLLIRSGIEILSGHPMLYFNDHCRPGSEWVRFTNKRMFRNRGWTAEDEKQPYTPWLALPGNRDSGLAFQRLSILAHEGLRSGEASAFPVDIQNLLCIEDRRNGPNTRLALRPRQTNE